MSEPVQLEPGKRIMFFDAVIAVSGSQSSVINMYGYAIKGVITPAAFTGTTLTFFAAAFEEGPYLEVRDDAGALVSVVVAPNRYTVFSAATLERLAGVNFAKVASGAAEGAARQLKIIGGVSTK